MLIAKSLKLQLTGKNQKFGNFSKFFPFSCLLIHKLSIFCPISSTLMLRSRESNIRAFVKFVNCSERIVEVHWINYRGTNVHYTTLDPNTSVVVS